MSPMALVSCDVHRVVSTSNIRVDLTIRILRRTMENAVWHLERETRVSFRTAFSGLGVYGNSMLRGPIV